MRRNKANKTRKPPLWATKLLDRRRWPLLAAALVLIGAAYVWWVRTELARTRGAALAGLENRDIGQIMALADPRERGTLGLTEKGAALLMQRALWDVGARMAADVRPFIAQPERDRFDYIVTWADAAGRPIMMPRMGIQHYFEHDNRLFSVISFHRASGAWRFNVTHTARNAYAMRLGPTEGGRAFRQAAAEAGLTGFMDEYGRPHAFQQASGLP